MKNLQQGGDENLVIRYAYWIGRFQRSLNSFSILFCLYFVNYGLRRSRKGWVMKFWIWVSLVGFWNSFSTSFLAWLINLDSKREGRGISIFLVQCYMGYRILAPTITESGSDIFMYFSCIFRSVAPTEDGEEEVIAISKIWKLQYWAVEVAELNFDIIISLKYELKNPGKNDKKWRGRDGHQCSWNALLLSNTYFQKKKCEHNWFGRW